MMFRHTFPPASLQDDEFHPTRATDSLARFYRDVL